MGESEETKRLARRRDASRRECRLNFRLSDRLRNASGHPVKYHPKPEP